jgi:hypothetical protein
LVEKRWKKVNEKCESNGLYGEFSVKMKLIGLVKDMIFAHDGGREGRICNEGLRLLDFYLHQLIRKRSNLLE